jgi:hypothetical protein
MKEMQNRFTSGTGRRSFIKRGLAAAGTATIGSGLLANRLSVLAQEEGQEEYGGGLTKYSVS